MGRDIGEIDDFAWDSQPPLDKGPVIPIIRASFETGYLCVLLSRQIEGVWMHSIAKRDTPCLGHRCPHKTASGHEPQRWKGYFPAFDLGVGRMVLAEITHGAWLDWVKLAEPKVMPERGRALWMKRLARHKNAKVKIEFRSDGLADAELPACFDVRKALVRIWTGLDRKEEPATREGE